MDGKVCSWGYEGGTLSKKSEILDLSTTVKFSPGITAMDLNEKTGVFLVGTCSAKIFSFDPKTKKTSLIL